MFADLKTIAKFAQMEYKLGDAERGKTIFEGIIDSHPKRWDLWSVYLDMEAAQENVQSIRSIFERLFSQTLTTHKAKQAHLLSTCPLLLTGLSDSSSRSGSLWRRS